MLGSALVLDLDETLIFTTPEPIDSLTKIDYKMDGLVGYHRPHLKEFLQFARKNFSFVIVFTAGTKAYAEFLVRDLEKLSSITFDKVFDRSSCTEETENVSFLDYWNRYAKQLSVIREQTKSLPIDWDDSLLIDDLSHNVRDNLAQAILIPKFSKWTFDEHVKDDWLVTLMHYVTAKPTNKKWSQVDKTFWFL